MTPLPHDKPEADRPSLTPEMLRTMAARAQRCEREHRHHGYCVERMTASADLLALADTLERQTEALKAAAPIIGLALSFHSESRCNASPCDGVTQIKAAQKLVEEALHER